MVQLIRRYLTFELFSSVPVNIRAVVYCTAIAEGGEAEWNFLWQKYLAENVATEQVVILAALGCSLDKTILEVRRITTCSVIQKSGGIIPFFCLNYRVTWTAL